MQSIYETVIYRKRLLSQGGFWYRNIYVRDYIDYILEKYAERYNGKRYLDIFFILKFTKKFRDKYGFDNAKRLSYMGLYSFNRNYGREAEGAFCPIELTSPSHRFWDFRHPTCWLCDPIPKKVPRIIECNEGSPVILLDTWVGHISSDIWGGWVFSKLPKDMFTYLDVEEYMEYRPRNKTVEKLNDDDGGISVRMSESQVWPKLCGSHRCREIDGWHKGKHQYIEHAYKMKVVVGNNVRPKDRPISIEYYGAYFIARFIEFMMAFNKKCANHKDIKALRESAQKTVTEAAKQVHITARAWYRYESGDRKMPKYILHLFCEMNGIEYPPK